MQSRFTVKGVTNDNTAVVLAYELKEEEFKVDLYLVPKKALTPELTKQLEKGWVDGEEFSFPEETQLITPNLNAESILPDDIKSDEAGKIRIRQNEWAYQLLTAKLWESYLHELEELKARAAALTHYDRKLFDDAKSFWERVLEHRKERDISQERLDKIKDDVNSIFEKLKTFRKSESAEFETISTKQKDDLMAKLEDIRKRIGTRTHFKALMEEFKQLQNETRKLRFTKADDVQVRKAMDALYHFVNEQHKHFVNDKTESRIRDLKEISANLEASLERDRKDLAYYGRKANSNNIKSLELQLIKVKTNMLNEAMAGKEVKLKDVKGTLAELERQQAKINKPPKPKKEKESIPETTTETPITKTEEVTPETVETPLSKADETVSDAAETSVNKAEEASPNDEPNPSPAE